MPSPRQPRAIGEPSHILHVFYGFRVGGSETRTCQLINALGRDYRHTVVALDGDFSARSLVASEADVAYLHPKGFLRRSYLSNALSARRWLATTRPDLMIAYSWGGFEWLVGNSFSKFCPDIFGIEGFDTDEAHGESPRRRFLRRLFSKRCTALHACSLNLRNLAVSSWKVPPEQVSYIPNGIDLARFTPRAAGTRPPRVVLGIVASLSPVKNHLLLLDAFRRLPPGAAELQIVGDGPEQTRIAKYVEESGLGGDVRLLGHQADPSPILRGLDVFCLSSKSEQMPIAVLEAMGTALPVAGTDVGDVRQMVCEDNRRFIVPPDNPAALSAALGTLIADAALRARLGEQNRRRCEEEFDLSMMVQRHKALYDRCTDGRGPGRTAAG
jgi:glycosyltransferase involved in cell wall biosynthesis